MWVVRPGPLVVVLGTVIVVVAVDLAHGLGGLSWAVGVGTAIVAAVALDVAMRRYQRARLGPADHVTLVRLVLTCAAVGLVVQGLVVQGRVVQGVVGSASVAVWLSALTGVAWLLDGVDGRVARRTGTASALGARLDGEVDAFMILVLSVAVAPVVGWWVLLIGAARYVFWGAGGVLPWLRAPLPPRYGAKVVAAVQGGVLVVAAAQVLPVRWSAAALAVALLLLVQSFGHDVWWLWRTSDAASRRVRVHGVAARE